MPTATKTKPEGTTVTNLRIRIDRAAFAEAAGWVAGAISRNPVSPILAGMHLTAVDGRLWLSGFDYETSHRAVTDADISTEGEVVVSARFLVQIVSAMKGDTIELVEEAGRLAITAGRSTYRARTMVATDYPTLPEFPAHVGTLDADRLVEVLSTVEHAVSKDTNLAALTAYNLTGDAGHLTAITTDRFRMASAATPWADASGTAFAVNVPATTLSAAKGLVGAVALGAAGGSFGLRDDGRSIITRVLAEEHKFPRTEPIFAAVPLTHVEVSTVPLIEALKRAQVVADENTTVSVTFTDGLISISADDGASDGSEEVDCATGFGEGEMHLRFNASHLSQALAASPTPLVRIGLTAPGKQIKIEPVDDPSVVMVVMPRQATK